MSDGRLARVRDGDRHISVLAGSMAAACASVVVLLLRLLGFNASAFGWSSAVTDVMAIVICSAAAAVEASLASSYAHRVAVKFAPLPGMVRTVATTTAIANAAIALIGATLSFGGEQRIVAIIVATTVAVMGSIGGAAVFGWSHAVDWPEIPVYLGQTPQAVSAPHASPITDGAAAPDHEMAATHERLVTTAMSSSNQGAMEIELEAMKNEIVLEPPRLRKHRSVNDDAWDELLVMLSGDSGRVLW